MIFGVYYRIVERHQIVFGVIAVVVVVDVNDGVLVEVGAERLV